MLVDINKAHERLMPQYIQETLLNYKESKNFLHIEAKKIDLMKQNDFPSKELVADLGKTLIPMIPDLVNGKEIRKKVVNLFINLPMK
ncbi:hypothetical protein K8R66_01745 [bacterium]|nr:hypothetical protein [bacterium]